jgi:hypothetical protein
MTVDDQVFVSASRAYERGRRRWAAWTAAPLLVLPLISYAVGHRLGSSLAIGALLLGCAALLLWRGGELAQGLSAGVRAGLVPLVLAHGANLYGHICTPAGCTSLCVPACALGGIAAGLLVARAAARSSHQTRVLASGAAVAVMVGALGCACIGFSGMAGMVAGTVAASLLARVWVARSA